MSKVVMTGTPAGGKLSHKDAEFVLELRRRAIDLVFYHHEIGLPKRKDDILDILYCFIFQNTPLPHRPRDIAKLVDEGIAAEIKKGMPLEAAVTSVRKFYATLYGKSAAAVKAAHLRHGTLGATKKQKV